MMAPMMPTTMSPMIPNPAPRVMWPASQPAMRPTIRMTSRLALEICMGASPANNGRHLRPTLQREHEQHRCGALVLELRRVDELGARRVAGSRRDRDVLLAVDRERHGRGRE